MLEDVDAFVNDELEKVVPQYILLFERGVFCQGVKSEVGETDAIVNADCCFDILVCSA